jgi:hypothetical protein
MPRPSKYDEPTEVERIKYFTKIFMYNSESFKNIGPVVEIIKNIDTSIIAYKYGKHQETIKLYGCQYFHRVIGYELLKPNDYLDTILNGMVKFIFIFSNSSDNISSNLLNLAEKYKKFIICYSDLDSKYHFYDYSGYFEKSTYSNAIDVINKIKEVNDFIEFKKIVDIFPEFDIIPEPSKDTEGCLDRCVEILRANYLEEKNNRNERSVKIIPYIKDPVFKRKTIPKPIKSEPEPIIKNRLTDFFKKKDLKK